MSQSSDRSLDSPDVARRALWRIVPVASMVLALLVDSANRKLLCAGIAVGLSLFGVGYVGRHWRNANRPTGLLLTRTLSVVTYASAAVFLCAALGSPRDFAYWVGFVPLLLWVFRTVGWPMIQPDDLIARGPGNGIPAKMVKFGLFYYNRDDEALYAWISPGLVKGWNTNVANRWVWVVLVVTALLAISPFLVLIFQ